MAISRYNFNTPLLDEKGEIVYMPKTDKTKVRIRPDGNAQEKPMVDEEGFAIMEPVLLKDVLVRILAAPHKNDEALSYEERVERGKLTRKVHGNSEVNYTPAQLVMIQQLSTAVGTTALLTQLDEIINGKKDDEAEDGKKAA